MATIQCPKQQFATVEVLINPSCRPTGEEGEPFPEPSAEHMLEFSLKVKCQRNPKRSTGRDDPKHLDEEDPRKLYSHSDGESSE